MEKSPRMHLGRSCNMAEIPDTLDQRSMLLTSEEFVMNVCIYPLTEGGFASLIQNPPGFNSVGGHYSSPSACTKGACLLIYSELQPSRDLVKNVYFVVHP